MAGLSLGVGAQVRSGAPQSFSAAPSGTAYQQGFGVGSTNGDSSTATGLAALIPNDPGGVAFWGGIASLVLLIALYHTLPN